MRRISGWRSGVLSMAMNVTAEALDGLLCGSLRIRERKDFRGEIARVTDLAQCGDDRLHLCMSEADGLPVGIGEVDMTNPVFTRANGLREVRFLDVNVNQIGENFYAPRLELAEEF